MTNSQRFGGGLLHFWLLSTVYWPEACTSRTQAQGKCMCMETGIYIHTKRAHTHTHTGVHTNMHAHIHTEQTTKNKQLGIVAETSKAEKQVGVLAFFGGFVMLQQL